MRRSFSRARLPSCIMVLISTSAGLAAGAPARGQHGARAGQWQSYGGDLGSTKYSPLDQISAQNFKDLEIAWKWTTTDAFLSKTESGGEWWSSSQRIFDQLQDDDPNRWRGGLNPRIRNLKATPLMVGEALYLNTPLSVGVALDARTGKPLWSYNPKSYESGTTTMSVIWNQRGVAYWSDGEEERIFWGTGDGYLIAVDAKTGRPCDDFGVAGRVDLMAGLPRATRGARDYLNALLYSVQSPPIVVRDVVITPASIADRRITKESIPGWIRGWDVRSGGLKWVFHTVPQAGEDGVETWERESFRYSGNANVWTMMSADPELGYVYLPTGTATNDFYGGHRLGDNLYAESLVAVDVETGKRVWHFQMVHHGLWDYDNPAAPNLVDITVGGRKIKAVAQVTKQGLCFVFDRVTGEPVWPIEERRVPPTTMPGDLASPTQPFPTKPLPFEYYGVSLDDLADFTPEIRAMAVEVVKDFKLGPLYTPPSLPVEGGTQGTLMRPNTGGGANWTGAAVDPETAVLYVPSRNSHTVIHFYTPDPKKGGTLRYTHGGRGRRPQMPHELPLFKPPYSRITAIDLNTGEHLWMAPTGNGEALRNHPMLKPLDLPPLGGGGRGGPLLTKTLLIHAQTEPEEYGGPVLVARDKATGAIVGEVPLPGPGLGTPMTYLLDGRQYIALTINAPIPELIALRLP